MIVETTQEKVNDLASVIQISVQELTSVRPTDRDRLQNYVARSAQQGSRSFDRLEPEPDHQQLQSEADRRRAQSGDRALADGDAERSRRAIQWRCPPRCWDCADAESTVYLIPVEVEDHLLGYVRGGGEFQRLRPAAARLPAAPAHRSAFAIFAIGLVFAYFLAERYVEPIHAVAAAAQNIAARGLEPVPEVRRRDEIGLLTRSFNEMVAQLRHAREREQELNRLERFTALGQLAGGAGA